MIGLVDGFPKLGRAWKGIVECFVHKRSRLNCTLLLQWEAGYEHPWVVITDLPPQEANVAWYGVRTWVEAGEKRCAHEGAGGGITA